MTTALLEGEVSQEDLLGLALEHLECNMESLMEAETLSEAIEDLEAIRVNITTYGFDRPAIGFANHSGHLVAAIPQIPAVENFDAEGVVQGEFTVEAAEEAILDKIKETASRWHKAIKAHIEKYKKFYAAGLALIIAGVVAIVGYKKYTENKKLMEQWEKKRDTYSQELEGFADKAGVSALHGRGEDLSMRSEYPELRMQSEHKKILDEFKSTKNPRAIIDECIREAQVSESLYKKMQENADMFEKELSEASSPEKRKSLNARLRIWRRGAIFHLRNIKFYTEVAKKTHRLYE